jgi:hypothetical protein
MCKKKNTKEPMKIRDLNPLLLFSVFLSLNPPSLSISFSLLINNNNNKKKNIIKRDIELGEGMREKRRKWSKLKTSKKQNK